MASGEEEEILNTSWNMMVMMEEMRRQNEERVEESRRVQEELKKESALAREMLNESLQIQDQWLVKTFNLFQMKF